MPDLFYLRMAMIWLSVNFDRFMQNFQEYSTFNLEFLREDYIGLYDPSYPIEQEQF